MQRSKAMLQFIESLQEILESARESQLIDAQALEGDHREDALRAAEIASQAASGMAEALMEDEVDSVLVDAVNCQVDPFLRKVCDIMTANCNKREW